MKVTIIGLPQSGKTSVFNSLTGIRSGSGKGEGHRIQIRNVKVRDVRLGRLAEIFNPPKIIHVDIDFLDMVAPRTDQKGNVLTPQAIAEIRNADAVMIVVRAFDSPLVVHPLKSVDPLRDIRAIEAELCLTDMIQVEKRLEGMKKERSTKLEKDVLIRAKECLDAETPLRLHTFDKSESKLLSGFSFLSQKASLLLINIGESEIREPLPNDIVGYAEKNGHFLTGYCAEIEQEIAELDREDQQAFLSEMGLQESGKERLIGDIYKMLCLISFFTVADTEIRAWSVPRGTQAVKAAGKVHSDMERGFIRAEVINSEELAGIGSMQAARDGGHLRLEGKEYEVQDGDLIKFRFNV